MKESILQVLRYFSTFAYPPKISEIYQFLDSKCTVRKLEGELQKLAKENEVFIKNGRVALINSFFTEYEKRRTISVRYIQESDRFLKSLSQIPFIYYIGISGSLSMLNTSKAGDIDVFIITTDQTIWITRFSVLVLKKIFSVQNNNIGKKICFNLFFSEKGLQLPLNKRNEYIAHELLQLKTVVNKNNMYERLLDENRWIEQYFPNIKEIAQSKASYDSNNKVSKLLTLVDRLLKFVQLQWLQVKKYKWKEPPGQLWLIQDDFEQKIGGGSGIRTHESRFKGTQV